jgi:ankyrin repeat protein
VAVVQMLLENGATPTQARTDNGISPLFVAAEFGRIDVARVLLESGAAVNQARTDDGATPLSISAQEGHVEMVRVLLAHGASVNQATIDDGSTPLHTATWDYHVDVVNVLLANGATVNQATTDTGTTPLLIAAYDGLLDVVQVLLENGAAVNQARTDDGGTPLHSAAWQGHSEVAQLLAVFGAKIASHTILSHTPHSIAAQFEHSALAAWFAAVDTWSPLQIAAGCRLFRAATTAVKLGVVDPEQGGVGAMLAARATAETVTPWGAFDSEDESLVSLVHVPLCPGTTKFVRAVTSGWSASRHWLHHSNVRSAVHTIVLVAQRRLQHAKSTVSDESAPPPPTLTAAVPTKVLPHMPPELWLEFARFILRSDWPVMAAARGSA